MSYELKNSAFLQANDVAEKQKVEVDDPDHTQAAILIIRRAFLNFHTKERWIALAGVHKHIYVGNPRCVHIAMQHSYP